MHQRIRFEWDLQKAAANAAKHGVGFVEAQSVFSDDAALLIDDPDHSQSEERFILLGMSAGLRVLVVIHVYLERELVIRIISARKATRLERAWYSGEWKL